MEALSSHCKGETWEQTLSQAPLSFSTSYCITALTVLRTAGIGGAASGIRQ
jgi:hypothetical protein